MEELQKYLVQGMIAEELTKEQDESFVVLNESGEEIKPVAGRPMSLDQRAIRHLIAESIMGECYPMSVGGNQAPVNPKIEKTRKMVQVVQDMLWRVSDTALTGDDDSIQKTVQDACYPLIRTMVQKLYDLWVLNNGEDKKPEEKPAEKPAEQPSMVQTLQPVGVASAEAPVMSLTFSQGESITSPQNITYIIEAVEGDILRLKEKATGKKATVQKAIAAKWKK